MICLYICLVGLTEFGPLVPSDQGHSLPMRILRASLAEPCGALPAENPIEGSNLGIGDRYFWGDADPKLVGGLEHFLFPH